VQKSIQQVCNKQLINKPETTGSVSDNMKGVVCMKKPVRTPENFHCDEQALMQSPKKSVKCLSQQLGLGASST
jgi:hypothetical protein